MMEFRDPWDPMGPSDGFDDLANDRHTVGQQHQLTALGTFDFWPDINDRSR